MVDLRNHLSQPLSPRLSELQVALRSVTGLAKLADSVKFEPDDQEDDLTPFDDLLEVADNLDSDDVQDWASERGWEIDDDLAAYVDTDGEPVSREQIEDELNGRVAADDDEILAATTEMLDKDLSVADWELEVALIVAVLLLNMFAFGRGGRDLMTSDDWDLVRDRARVQLEYLRQFSLDIVAATQSADQIKARVRLYTQDDRLAESEGRDALHPTDEWPYYRNMLGIPAEKESCQQCIDLTGLGWVERGDLTPLGQRTCNVNDYCYFEYAKELPEDDEDDGS